MRRDEAPRRVDKPEPGWFVMRLVRGGWLVPCSIAYDEGTGRWSTTIDGETVSAIDPAEAGVWRVWLTGRRIEEWQFKDMEDLREWAKANDPAHPCLTPRRRIDPMLLAPVKVPKGWAKS